MADIFFTGFAIVILFSAALFAFVGMIISAIVAVVMIVRILKEVFKK